MNEDRTIILDRFLKSIDTLYNNIRFWLSPYGLSILQEEIEIAEEASGTYKANKFIIQDDKNETIASIIPVGAWVIAANGRVDLIGKLDKVIIVNLEKDGLLQSPSVKAGDYQDTATKQFYKGIKQAGWYWIEDKRRGKAHLLDKELFFELLSEVSDYEF
ncbi:hypothetical protein [Desulfobotulus mexicanus]|uniref:Uncharacterized protein n=1 Tax=Desulfobotulus mexicanus TaxID=2586642 RepID=A0A5S5MFH8_9BACT|nr:hypothetical protein [Desulfobotulus mexicanus]TYT74473.1 hypothetical protein FIM25_09985 [Desulfobotulus mexicanus]